MFDAPFRLWLGPLLAIACVLPGWNAALAQEPGLDEPRPAEPGPRVLRPIDPEPEWGGESPAAPLDESPVGFGARVDLLVAAFDGEIERERDRIGTKIDLDEELHFDDHQAAYVFSLWLRLGSWAVLEGSYLRVASDSSGRSRDDLIWDSQGIARGAFVRTEYTFQQALVGVRLRVMRERNVEVGIPVGLLWTEQWLRIDLGTPRTRLQGKVDHWSPYVGVQVDAVFLDTLGELGVQGRVLTFVYGHSHALSGFLDFGVYLTWGYEDYVRAYMGPRVFLQGAYRSSGHDDRQSFVELYAFDLGLSLGF